MRLLFTCVVRLSVDEFMLTANEFGISGVEVMFTCSEVVLSGVRAC